MPLKDAKSQVSIKIIKNKEKSQISIKIIKNKDKADIKTARNLSSGNMAKLTKKIYPKTSKKCLTSSKPTPSPNSSNSGTNTHSCSGKSTGQINVPVSSPTTSATGQKGNGTLANKITITKVTMYSKRRKRSFT